MGRDHEECAAESRVSDDVSSRLVIRDIQVENFKSYAGVHNIGPFHKTFTAVIGPNGSGKSNVIDAMLFVFGKNAKKIRLEKLSELIHVSAAYPDLTYASVTVNFVRIRESAEEMKDPDYRLEIPGNLLSIKREVHRSGTSQYFIGCTKKTQRDVIDTLIKEGVDLEHNRFLILQGEVEQIALMKPKAEKEGEEGLLEYLDDLIGTNNFAGRISQATKEAEETQLRRLESLDHERKLRAEREALDDAKDSTIAFVTKDNHLQKTLIVMCQLRMQSLEEKLAEPRRVLAEIDERIDGLKRNVETQTSAKASADEDLLRRKKELAEATKERDAVRSKKNAADAEVERVKSGADEQVKARRRVQDLIKKARDEAQRAELHQQDADREATIHQQNLDEATQLSEELQREHDRRAESLVPIFKPLRQALEQKRAAAAPYELAVTEASEQLSTARSRLEAFDAEAARREDALRAISVAQQTHAARIAEIESLLRDADEDSYKDELQRLQDALAAAAERKHETNRAIQEIKSTYREGEADDRAMEFLLSQRSLKGYYGTLRQLGRIADEYDIAAGVASNAWGFHVVEDRETATRALELLKKHNIGRATMMVLQEIERGEFGQRLDASFTTPSPKAQRLFDLVRPTSARFRIAFYQALRDTLVVSDLTSAREVAFGSATRWRVVTPRGELIEPSGGITGGGGVPRGAKLKAARSPQDKQAARAELQRLQEALVAAAEDERAVQEQLHELRAQRRHLAPQQRSRLSVELQTLRAAVEREEKRRAAAERDAADEETRRKLSERRMALVECVQEAVEADEAAQKARVRHRADVERIETEIECAGGAEFRELAEKLRRQMERTDAEEKALRECRRTAERMRATQERKRRDVTEYEEELQRINAEEARNIAGALAVANEQAEEVARLLIAAESKFARAQGATEDAKAAVPLAQRALVEAQKKLDDEERFRQVETARMADALQELAKFEQKIEGCEEKIKENMELYGAETLQLFPSEGHAQDAGEEEDVDEEREQSNTGEDDGDEEDSDEEESSHTHNGQRATQSRKRNAKTRRSNTDAAAEEEEEEDNDNERNANARRRRELTSAEIRALSFRLPPDELARCDYERSVHLAKALSEETRRLHSEIDFRAVALWRERDKEHRRGLEAYLASKELSDAAERRLVVLKDERRGLFMECFGRIQARLKEVYQLLTHGGDADLELVDASDPFEGIQFVVRPPKKSWKQISNLSGGEKTLSSLALIFALHHIKPTPVYVMDEIDAALDFRNVSIVANYLLRQTSGAQFIIISLRNNMFEMAHQLVGVCKVMDVTRTLVLMPRAFRRVVEAALIGPSRDSRRRTRGGDPKTSDEHCGDVDSSEGDKGENEVQEEDDVEAPAAAPRVKRERL